MWRVVFTRNPLPVTRYILYLVGIHLLRTRTPPLLIKHTASVLILHPREIKLMWSQTAVKQRNQNNRHGFEYRYMTRQHHEFFLIVV